MRRWDSRVLLASLSLAVGSWRREERRRGGTKGQNDGFELDRRAKRGWVWRSKEGSERSGCFGSGQLKG